MIEVALHLEANPRFAQSVDSAVDDIDRSGSTTARVVPISIESTTPTLSTPSDKAGDRG